MFGPDGGVSRTALLAGGSTLSTTIRTSPLSVDRPAPWSPWGRCRYQPLAPAPSTISVMTKQMTRSPGTARTGLPPKATAPTETKATARVPDIHVALPTCSCCVAD
jgi:hypothetical protein